MMIQLIVFTIQLIGFFGNEPFSWWLGLFNLWQWLNDDTIANPTKQLIKDGQTDIIITLYKNSIAQLAMAGNASTSD